MKTITEFPSQVLKNAAQNKQDLLSSGKTPEELSQLMGESLKLEGDRLSYLVNALDAVGTHLTDLKRVVVYTLNEGEKAPQGAVQKGEHYYLVEYYPSLAKKAHPGKTEGDRPGRGKGKERGKRGSKRGDKREDGPRNQFRPNPNVPKITPNAKPKITPVNRIEPKEATSKTSETS